MPGVYLRHSTEQPIATAQYIAVKHGTCYYYCCCFRCCWGTVLSNAAQCSAGQCPAPGGRAQCNGKA
jgi:hypothetical protein